MTCFRLTELIQRNAARHAVGIMVDRVSDLPGRTPAHLRPALQTSVSIPGGHAAAIGSVEDRAVILIELEEILSCAGRGQVEHAPHQPATGFIPRH